MTVAKGSIELGVILDDIECARHNRKSHVVHKITNITIEGICTHDVMVCLKNYVENTVVWNMSLALQLNLA